MLNSVNSMSHTRTTYIFNEEQRPESIPCNNMKGKKKPHTVGIVPQSNMQILERGLSDSCNV